jgi:predicted ATPase
MARRNRPTNLPPPFLKRVWLPEDLERSGSEWEEYPLSLPLVKSGALDLQFDRAVTILVGENGSGKSTLLEAIAVMAGFDERGGAQGMRAVGRSALSGDDAATLGDLMRAAWLPKIRTGWFFRAETFHAVASYLDDSGSNRADFLSSSHGEGFLQFFEERLERQGLFILDEPEAALSPLRQFDFMKLLRRMQRANNCQVIMATHSPILMALPDADLWQIDAWSIHPTSLEETAHFRLYREFVQYPHETIEAMIE